MFSAVHYRVMEHLGSLESTQETRVALGYRLGQLLRYFRALQTSHVLHNSIVHAKTWANCYYNVARASPILILLSHNEQNVYVRTAVLNKMTCAVSFQLRNFLRVYEDYSEQFKPYFEPLTFAWQRCLLQREYFNFVYLYFHWVFVLCLASFSL